MLLMLGVCSHEKRYEKCIQQQTLHIFHISQALVKKKNFVYVCRNKMKYFIFAGQQTLTPNVLLR